uniref:Follistatin like 3 n=1 Tax=Nothoprocta perdicaria TaxID=30464 RepID=A0A8C6YMC2_NOTPE
MPKPLSGHYRAGEPGLAPLHRGPGQALLRRSGLLLSQRVASRWRHPGGFHAPRGAWPALLGGICWLQQGKEAKCTMILKTGVSWEECCANGNVDVAWSNYTYPGNKISLLGFLGLVSCHPCKESCEGVVCGPGKECRMRHGRPHCACAPDCSRLPRKLQVCGSDGVTYRDECELLTARCRDHPDLHVMYQGKCKSRCPPAPGALRPVSPPHGTPGALPGTRIPLAPAPGMVALGGAGTPLSFGPSRPCFPCREGPRSAGHRPPRPPVPAESCSSVVCPGTHTCVVDQTGSAHCVVCRTAPCPEPGGLDRALCGNNNVTYPSACHLRRATCHLGRSIGVRHYGSCSGARRRAGGQRMGRGARGRDGMGSLRVEWTRVQWDGLWWDALGWDPSIMMQWDVLGRDASGWDEMGWDRVRWDGTGCRRVEWTRMGWRVYGGMHWAGILQYR